MRKLLAALAAVALALLISGLPSHAQDKPSKHQNTSEEYEAKQAHSLLDRAVAYYKQNGDRAFEAFNDPKGKFVEGELYVFVVGMDGKMYAHGGSHQALVGRNVMKLRDALGKPMIADMIEMAKHQEQGSIDYRWLNRYDNRVEPKTTFFQRVGDRIIAVGYYLPRSTADQALDLLSQAVNTLRREGPEAFKQFNDPDGKFVRDDLYVFVVGLNDGKFHAYGASPSLTGTDARSLRDAKGKPIIEEMIELAKAKGGGRVSYVWRNPVTNKIEGKDTFVQKTGDYLIGVGYYKK